MKMYLQPMQGIILKDLFGVAIKGLVENFFWE